VEVVVWCALGARSIVAAVFLTKQLIVKDMYMLLLGISFQSYHKKKDSMPGFSMIQLLTHCTYVYAGFVR
jgi:rhodanese-related sulfurtransferase